MERRIALFAGALLITACSQGIDNGAETPSLDPVDTNRNIAVKFCGETEDTGQFEIAIEGVAAGITSEPGIDVTPTTCSTPTPVD